MARQTLGHKKHITIHDVAAQSGVSYQTVSLVINNMPDVAPKTRLRILNVMEDLGYRPNMTAREMCVNVPLVAVDCDLGFEAPSVHVRQEYGAYLATKYLLSLGHTKVAYLRGPMVWRVARLRYQGWLKAMKEAGHTPGPCIDGNWTSRGGFEATLKLLREDREGFTALAVANDQMALGAIQACEENGL